MLMLSWTAPLESLRVGSSSFFLTLPLLTFVSIGFGFVTFAESATAADVLKQQHSLEGRQLAVNTAKVSLSVASLLFAYPPN